MDVISRRERRSPGLAEALRTLQGICGLSDRAEIRRLPFDQSTSTSCMNVLQRRDEKNWLRFGVDSDGLVAGAGSGGNLLVFAQMEREAIGERTREPLGTSKRVGITLGRCRMGSGRFLRRTIHG